MIIISLSVYSNNHYHYQCPFPCWLTYYKFNQIDHESYITIKNDSRKLLHSGKMDNPILLPFAARINPIINTSDDIISSKIIIESTLKYSNFGKYFLNESVMKTSKTTSYQKEVSKLLQTRDFKRFFPLFKQLRGYCVYSVNKKVFFC